MKRLMLVSSHYNDRSTCMFHLYIRCAANVADQCLIGCRCESCIKTSFGFLTLAIVGPNNWSIWIISYCVVFFFRSSSFRLFFDRRLLSIQITYIRSDTIHDIIMHSINCFRLFSLHRSPLDWFDSLYLHFLWVVTPRIAHQRSTPNTSKQ